MANNYNFTDFKRSIDLVDFALYWGYEIDRKKTTKRSIALRHDNDKIIVSKKNGVWVYFSVYDDNDNGTIIDFIQNRSPSSWIELLEELQQFSGKSDYQLSNKNKSIPDASDYEPKRIERLFNTYSLTEQHTYLHHRSIPKELLLSNRFYTKIYQDKHNNAVFPHWKGTDVCGLELKGTDISLMVRGSEKTLWRSNFHKHDKQLVIAEAPIDALSYHSLFSLKDAFYVATSGGVSANQLQIICRLLSDFPRLENVVIITDHDIGGEKLASKLEDHIILSGYKGTLNIHKPDQEGWDWNDVLQSSII